MGKTRTCGELRYPSSLQDFGPLQALVDEQRLLLVAVGGGLHLRVDRVQIPAERVALQPLPQRHALADVAVTPVAQLWTQREILLLIG